MYITHHLKNSGLESQTEAQVDKTILSKLESPSLVLKFRVIKNHTETLLNSLIYL